MSLRWGHYRVLLVALLGQVLGASLSTLIGIILPLIQIIRHPELTSFQQGLICSIELVGIMLGSLFIGHLSDKFGYLKFFRICPAVVLVAAGVLYFTDSITIFTICLFVMGVAIGGGYSLDPDYISEIMPKRWKQLMVGVAKSSAAVGNLLMAGACFLLLKHWQEPVFWNKLLVTVIFLSLVMILSRIRFTESPGWLIAHERIPEAEKAVKYFLGNDVDLGEIRQRPAKKNMRKVSWKELFNRKNRGRIILTGIPWACEGVGVYGIGVFTPILVMALGLEAVSGSRFSRVLSSIEVTTYINIFILVGFVVGLLLVNKRSHIKIQANGFYFSAVSLILLLFAFTLHWPLWISLVGFMAFELFLNAGPHLMTFILPSQVYTLEERGSGVGLSAAFGKFGAVVGVIFVPLLLKWGGVLLVLAVSAGINVLGGFVTWFVGRKVMLKGKEKAT